MHECPWCGQVCDCDVEDTWLEAPDDCMCGCGGPYEDRIEDDGGFDSWLDDQGFECWKEGNDQCAVN